MAYALPRGIGPEIVGVLVSRQVHCGRAARREVDGDVCDPGRSTRHVVREDVIADIHSGRSGAAYSEGCGHQARGRGPRHRAIQIDGIVVNLVARSGVNENPEYTKVRAEGRAARHVMIDVADEVVPDDGVISGVDVDTVGRKRVAAEIDHALDVVPLDDCSIGDNGYAADRGGAARGSAIAGHNIRDAVSPQDVAGDSGDRSRLIDNAERCIGGRGGHAKSGDRVVLDDRVDRAISEHDACVIFGASSLEIADGILADRSSVDTPHEQAGGPDRVGPGDVDRVPGIDQVGSALGRDYTGRKNAIE